MRSGKLIGKLALALGSGLFALAALEIVLRVFGPAPPPVESTLRSFTEYDSELGWKGRSSGSGPFDARGFHTTVSLNSGGWRDDEPPSAAGSSAGGARPYDEAPPRAGSGAGGAPPEHEAGSSRRTGGAGSGAAQDGGRASVTAPSARGVVLLIGDSFAWGYGVGRGEMFADRLEAIVPGCEVHNLGVSGYGTDQELLVLRRFARRVKPQVVVVQFAVENDVYSNLSADAYNLPKPRFVLEGSALRLEGVPVPRVPSWESDSRGSAQKTFLMRHSRLYAWARPRWAALRARISGLAGRDPEDVVATRRVRLLATPPAERIEAGWRLAEALLGAIRDEAAAAGARTVLLDVPDRLQVDDGLWEEAVRAFKLDRGAYDRDLPEARLRAIAERLGIGYVEMLGPLRRAMREGETLFLAEDIHWTVRGHEIAARELAKTVAPILESGASARASTPAAPE